MEWKSTKIVSRRDEDRDCSSRLFVIEYFRFYLLFFQCRILAFQHLRAKCGNNKSPVHFYHFYPFHMSAHSFTYTHKRKLKPIDVSRVCLVCIIRQVFFHSQKLLLLHHSNVHISYSTVYKMRNMKLFPALTSAPYRLSFTFSLIPSFSLLQLFLCFFNVTQSSINRIWNIQHSNVDHF